jgi:acetate---CoA ligase (ADP-forming)
VLIQQMIPRGVETLIGATLDETFGHVIAYGTGGTMVELMQDVALRLQPLTERDVDEMFAEVRGTALLRGWRGSPSADESAVRDILLRLSALLELCPEIEEVDFNPTLVQQHGAVVVDARIRVGSTSRRTGLRPVV